MEIRPRAAPRGGIPGPRGTPREIPRPPDFGPPNWGPKFPCPGLRRTNLRFGTQLICIAKKFLAKFV